MLLIGLIALCFMFFVIVYLMAIYNRTTPTINSIPSYQFDALIQHLNDLEFEIDRLREEVNQK